MLAHQTTASLSTIPRDTTTHHNSVPNGSISNVTLQNTPQSLQIPQNPQITPESPTLGVVSSDDFSELEDGYEEVTPDSPIVEDDFDDLYMQNIDKKENAPPEYKQFLKYLNQGIVLEDEEDDIEFIPPNEDENPSLLLDEEEYRMDLAVTVSNKEIIALLTERKNWNSGKRGRPKPLYTSLVPPDGPATLKPIKPLMIGSYFVYSSIMTSEQYDQLQRQIQVHLQLLFQIYALSLKSKVEKSDRSGKGEKVEKFTDSALNLKKLLFDLDVLRRQHIFIKDLESNPNFLSKSREERRFTRSQAKPLGVHEVSIYTDIQGFDESIVFFRNVDALPDNYRFDPKSFWDLLRPFHLWADKKYIPTFEKARGGRLRFTDSEDSLLALGLEKFGTDWKSIVQEFLPNKTVKQLTNRYKNMSSTRGNVNNPIKKLTSNRRAPLSDKEISAMLDGIRRFGLNWDQLAKHCAPQRKASALKKLWADLPQKMKERPELAKDERGVVNLVPKPLVVGSTPVPFMNVDRSKLSIQVEGLPAPNPSITNPSPTKWKAPELPMRKNLFQSPNQVNSNVHLFPPMNNVSKVKQSKPESIAPPRVVPHDDVMDHSLSSNSLFGFLDGMHNESALKLESKKEHEKSNLWGNDKNDPIEFEFEDIDTDDENIIKWDHEDLDLLFTPKEEVKWTKEEDKMILEHYLKLEIEDKSNPDDKEYCFVELSTSGRLKKKTASQAHERLLYLLSLFWHK